MFGLYLASMGSNGLGLPIKTFATFAEAIAYAETTFVGGIIDVDADNDNAADVVTAGGDIFAIQSV